MPPMEPKALPTHLPVFPGCQSLSRHLSDGVKRPVPLCHRHSPAGNPCAIVALLALGSSSQKRGLRVAGDSNPCAYLQTTANLSHFVVLFLSPPPYRLLHRRTSFLFDVHISANDSERPVIGMGLHHFVHHPPCNELRMNFVSILLFSRFLCLEAEPPNVGQDRCSRLRHQGENISLLSRQIDGYCRFLHINSVIGSVE